MTFCRKCWTSYDETTLPAECPHIGEPYQVIGGVPRPVSALSRICVCGHCDDDEDDDEV